MILCRVFFWSSLIWTRLGRNFLKGKHGDYINAILIACGLNLRQLYTVFLLSIMKWLENLISQIFSPISKIQFKNRTVTIAPLRLKIKYELLGSLAGISVNALSDFYFGLNSHRSKNYFYSFTTFFFNRKNSFFVMMKTTPTIMNDADRRILIEISSPRINQPNNTAITGLT